MPLTFLALSPAQTKVRLRARKGGLARGDPVFREALRRKKADRWGTGIAAGQKARCESVTYWD